VRTPSQRNDTHRACVPWRVTFASAHRNADAERADDFGSQVRSSIRLTALANGDMPRDQSEAHICTSGLGSEI